MRAIQPSPTVIQLSGEDDERRPFLSVVVKRTYCVSAKGVCEPAAEELPLFGVKVDASQRNLLLQDADIYPYKPLTDVVVLGHAYPPGAARRFTSKVNAGSAVKEVLVLGDRKCAISSTGSVLFSEPAPVDRIPLSYEHAYGGLDTVAEARYGNPYAPLMPYLREGMDVAAHSPYLYPRNPSGRGYLVESTREAVERVMLPNLEDPANPLSPGRLVSGSPLRWPHMPLPWSTSWMGHATFPRIGYAGAIRPHEAMISPFPEVERGFVPSDFPRIGAVHDVWNSRFWNGASMGLQLGPFGRGVERLEFRLSNLHPKTPVWSFRLPANAPVIRTDGRRGKLNETTPVLHTVLIEPDLDRVSVVWRGSAPAVRRYHFGELAAMPLLVEW